jgi:hypothetical protein
MRGLKRKKSIDQNPTFIFFINSPILKITYPVKREKRTEGNLKAISEYPIKPVQNFIKK